MHNSRIAHIFFDLDHTLWDFDRNSGLAFERVFKKHNIELPLPEFLEAYEPINLVYWKKYREERVTKEELRRGRLTEAFAHFDVSFPVAEIDAIAGCYIAELPINNHLFQGTVEILEYLLQKYRLHIITNGFEEVQYLKLNNSGIKKYFSTITTSEEVGLKKPHPSIFQAALAKAGALAQHSVMIGDSFEADVLGAANAGMHSVFFNYRNETVSAPGLTIGDLSEIKNFL